MKEIIKNVLIIIVAVSATLFIKEMSEFFKDPFDFDGLENIWFDDGT